MAKFCTKCGKPLEEGKVCDCQQSVSEEKKETAVATKTVAAGYFNLFLEIVKGIFIKPVDTMKKYATKENFIFACIAILVNSMVTGILLYCIAKESTSSFMGYGSLLGGTVEISFIKTFLLGTLFMIVGFAVTAGMIYVLAGPLFKSDMEFKKVTSLVGVCSIFTLITTIVTILCVFISMKFASLILLIAGLFYLIHLYQGISEISNLNKNKLAYVFVPSICVMVFVVTYVLPKILF